MYKHSVKYLAHSKCYNNCTCCWLFLFEVYCNGVVLFMLCNEVVAFITVLCYVIYGMLFVMVLFSALANIVCNDLIYNMSGLLFLFSVGMDIIC